MHHQRICAQKTQMISIQTNVILVHKGISYCTLFLYMEFIELFEDTDHMDVTLKLIQPSFYHKLIKALTFLPSFFTKWSMRITM